jgi:PST family polysaccharide transporter
MDEAQCGGILPHRDLGRRSAHGAVLSLAAQSLRFILQFLSQILLARLLLPADFGLVAMATSVLTLAQTLGELGLAQAVIQRPTLTQADLSLLFWLSILLNAGLAALLLLTAPVVAMFYGEPRLPAVLAVFAGTLLLNGVASPHMALMARRMQFARMAIVDVACLLVAVIAGLCAAMIGLGYWSLVIMQVSNIAVIALLASILSKWRPSLPAHASGVRSMLTFGAHLTGYTW